MYYSPSTLRRSVLAILLGTVMSGCQSTDTIFDRGVDTNATLERVLDQDNRLNTSKGTPTSAVVDSSQTPNTGFSINQDVEIGNGVFVRHGFQYTAPLAVEVDGMVSIAFDNAPIDQVVNAIIGDILKTNFVIDPSIKATVSLKTVKPISKQALPSLLNEALGLSGVSLIQSNEGGYLIVPNGAATKYSRSPSLAGAGRAQSGQIIFPLEFVSAAEMSRVLESMTPQGASIIADEVREILILSGTTSQLDTLAETISMFDVDWLTGMSFGVFETKFADPQDIVAELDSVFGGEEGPIGSQIQFIPMPRLSSVLVISKRPARLTQAESWIRRLDVNIGGEERQFKFLPVLNADAEAVAETLSDIFSDQAFSGSSRPSASGQSSRQNVVPTSSGNGPRIKADAPSNSLVVFATGRELRQIEDLLTNLDVLQDQVLIEAVIAEVSLNDDLRYGVQWFFDTRDGGNLIFSDANAGGVSARFPGFAYTFSSNFAQAALSALSAVTDIEVVSSPQIVTQDNQTATLQVGDQVPVVTQSAVSVDNPNAPIVNSIQYRDTGILLTVTPRINDGNVVVLEVSQEVSDAVPTVTSGIDAPTIQQRQFDSVVNITDGETLALGGLIRASRSRGKSGIPLLKDLPVIGNAFSTNSDNRNRTELIIFLTPHIIRSEDDARRASDHLKSKLTRLKSTGFGEDALVDRE